MFRNIRKNTDGRRLGLYIAGGAGAAYVSYKLVRYAVSAIFPSKFPGEPNTALLATPRPHVPLKGDFSVNEVKVEDLKDVTAYDYIIVGGGTAGCVLAARLSEDPAMSVLVVESGHSDLRQLFSRFPAGYTNLFKTAADHDCATAPEKECANRSMQWPQGKMLGGCSAINAQIYNKGCPDDYDEWAAQGLEGWAYNDLEPYMKKAECFTPNPAQQPLNDEDLRTHGTSGPWQTGYTYLSSITNVFLDAAAQAGFPRIADINTSKGMNGGVRFQTFISKNGQRSSTAVAYFTEDVLKRPNLSIATGVNVTRIVFDTSSSTPRAIGVEMASGAASPVRYLAKARREVVLSAGAVHSPHILKISGVGPAAELNAHNIPVVKDVPHVGHNLADHLIVKVNTRVKPGMTVEHLAHPLKALPSLLEWLRYGTGPGTTNTAESAVFYRASEHPTAPQSIKENDLTSGPRSTDMEILSCAAYYMGHGLTPNDLSLDYHSLGAILLRPQSRGTIELAGADPFSKPVIRANYLSTEHDRNMLVHGVRVCQEIVQIPTYQKDAFVQWEMPERAISDMSDDEVLAYVRKESETIYHPMCTARMSKDQEDGVVDNRLKVHGVEGLRVVDASIFPTPLACHPVNFPP